MIENFKKYNPLDETHISKKAAFLKNTKNHYDLREMVINIFKNKIIPLVDGSYSQYFEAEPEESDINWVQKPEEFINFACYLKNEVKDGFSVNFNQKGSDTINVGVSKIRKFVDDIESAKINDIETAKNRYLKNILPDKKFFKTRNIVKERIVKKGTKKLLLHTY